MAYHLLLSVLFHKTMDTGKFPDETLRAIKVTLPKPGKEPTHPQDVNPISLLNTDLKIFGKVIAVILSEVTTPPH